MTISREPMTMALTGFRFGVGRVELELDIVDVSLVSTNVEHCGFYRPTMFPISYEPTASQIHN